MGETPEKILEHLKEFLVEAEELKQKILSFEHTTHNTYNEIQWFENKLQVMLTYTTFAADLAMQSAR